MPDTSLYLCIDCGGSKTAAAIADWNGQILSRGFGGPANYNDAGKAKFIQAVSQATREALAAIPGHERLGIPLPEPVFAGVWIGASGIDRKQDVLDVTPAVSDLLHAEPGPRLSITNDTYLLASPLASYPAADTAIAVIGGTGSNVSAFRRGTNGGLLKELGRCGGWGWILGDEGSGFHVGKETLRTLLAASDYLSVTGNSPLSQTSTAKVQEAVFRHFGISKAYDLFSIVYAAEPTMSVAGTTAAPLGLERKHRIASLAPLVFALAFDSHDECALAILKTTARSLADQIRSVMEAPSSDEDRRIDPSRTILCFGGSLVGVEGYRQLIVDDLKKDGMVFAGAEFVDDVTASGAASLAQACV
ncbi:hypothetical protein M407DRAFT_71239 [Tulasnella calospora MUT 4182]|uniref:N-acetyl-D-glucosamine kinase n=1 Tax=Tulasnella calospora MUT 4182 TaxID=1051891 RepID=A0A0C3L534_9AGAM|nr:hypothetical protein M407DRAFT_71239 [Tulasnella calospora MUT 4182]